MYELWRKLFGHLKVFKKMMLVGFTTLISMIILSTLLLFSQEKMMIKEKKRKFIKYN